MSKDCKEGRLDEKPHSPAQRVEGGVGRNLPTFHSFILPILFFLVDAEDKLYIATC